MRRMLVTMSLVEQDTPIIGLDNKPLMTEKGVRDAVQRVAKELNELRQARGYSEGSGWTVEQPPVGENGIAFEVVELGSDGSGAFAVVGRMVVARP